MLKRDWSAVVRTLIAWVVSAVAGFVAAPGESVSYWGGSFVNLGRFGLEALSRGDNQSLRAVALRSPWGPDYSSPAMLLLSGLVLALGVEAARRQLRNNDDLGALSCIALAALLASPVSWTHHWVWVILPIAVLVSRAHLVRAWSVGAVFVVGPMWLVPMGNLQERHHTFPESVAAAAYVLVGTLQLLDSLVNRRVANAGRSARSRPLLDRAVVPGTAEHR